MDEAEKKKILPPPGGGAAPGREGAGGEGEGGEGGVCVCVLNISYASSIVCFKRWRYQLSKSGMILYSGLIAEEIIEE